MISAEFDNLKTNSSARIQEHGLVMLVGLLKAQIRVVVRVISRGR